MSGVIYQSLGDGELVPMHETPYESEDLLQELLEKYPDLMAGEQMSSADPRRWLLVCREMPVPDEEGGGGRWSLDHLFLDQDGIPTLVEVKRSTDTRIRREVVAQMLDYAANAVVHWPILRIQAMYSRNCERNGLDEEKELLAFLDGDRDGEDFWQKVKTNLQAGRVRMLFVADEIPSELLRIVEFLNVQMDPAEVLALEVKQFVGEGQRALVPRILGQTEEARQKKRATRTQRAEPWNGTSFLDFIRTTDHPEEEVIAAQIINWAKQHDLTIEGGSGAIGASLNCVLQRDNTHSKPFCFYKHPRNHTILHVTFEEIRKIRSSPEIIETLCDKLNRIPNAAVDSARHYPGITLDKLADPDSLNILLESFDWLIGELSS